MFANFFSADTQVCASKQFELNLNEVAAVH